MSFLLDTNLITTREASALSGYHSDYLARLCREGKISGSRVGRSWVIDRTSLLSFIEEQELQKKKHAEELVHSREAEYRLAQALREGAEAVAPRTPEFPIKSPYFPRHEIRDKALAAFVALAAINIGLLAANLGAVSGSARVAVGALGGIAESGKRVLADAGTLYEKTGEGILARIDDARSFSPERFTDALTEKQIALGASIIDASHAVLDTHERLAYGFAEFSNELPPRVITGFYRAGSQALSFAGMLPTRIKHSYDDATYAWIGSAQDIAERVTRAELAIGTPVVSGANGALAAVAAPARGLDPGRALALFTYETINNFFHRATLALGSLFSPNIAYAPSVSTTTAAGITTTIESHPTINQITQYVTNNPVSYVYGGVTMEYVQQAIDSVHRDLGRQTHTSSGGSAGLADLSGSSIEDLSDVGSMTKSFGDLFLWNGTEWTNVATSSLGIGAGTGSPGGTAGTVQFNSAGLFAGDAAFTFDSVAGRLSVSYASTTGISSAYASSTLLRAGTAIIDSLSATLATLTGLVTTNSTTTNATTTNIAVMNSFALGSDAFTDLTGPGLTASSGALAVDDVTPAMLQAADFGDFTCNGTSCSLDSTFENPLSFAYPLVRSGNNISLAFGTTSANTWSAQNTFAGLFATNASSTNATTTNLAVTGLSSQLLRTDASGRVTGANIGSGLTFDGTTLSATGGGGGTGTVSTSTSETAGNVAFWTSTAGTPATLGSNAGLQFNSAAGRLTATYASSTGVSSSYASSTNLFAGNFTLGTLSGLLKATSGVVSVATAGVDYLTSAITSIGPAGQGQTGASITLATSTSGTDFTITAAGNAITFNLPNASPSARGLLSIADWNLFNNKISSTSLSASAPLTYNSSTGAFTITQATTGTNGYVSSTDFTTFNNKISSTSLSGGTGISYVSSTGVISNTGVTSNVAGTGINVSGATGAVTITNTGVTNLSGTANQITASAGTGSVTLSLPSQLALQNASTTNLSANTLAVGGTGTTSISSAGALTTPSLTIGSLSGLLKAASGVVSVATAGVDYENPLTFAFPLVRSVNAISLAFGTTTQNFWSAYNNFTSLFATNASSTNATTSSLYITSLADGCLQTASGKVTSTGAPCGSGSGSLTAIGPAGQTQTGPTITFATSSTAYNGLTASTTIVGAGNTLTFSNTLSGTLGVGGGGTGQTTFNAGQLLYGNGTNALSSVATTTFTPSAEFTTTGTIGALIGGSNSTLAIATNGVALTKLAQIAANTILGNNTGATGNVTAFATSTLFGTGTGGQVLTWANGVPTFVATTTYSAPLVFSAGNVTITQAGTGANGYLSSTDFNTFNNKISSTSLSGGTGISYVSSTGVISNTGVTSLAGTANQITTSGATGAVTLSIPNRFIFPNSYEAAYGTTTYASSTALSASYASSTNLFAGNFTLGALNGLLKATAGLVSVATAGSDYENPLTFGFPLVRTVNAISLAFGTTTQNFWSAYNNFSSLFATNASSTNATTTNFHLTSASAGGLAADGNGRVYSAATTTAGTGLTYSGNAFNVNTSQNIAKLSNLTGNGFVKTSGGDGTLSIDTNTYLTSAITAIGPTGQTQTGPTITFATSSTAFNGLTSSTTITGAGNTLTFANTLSGVLRQAGGGTGITSYSPGDLLYADGGSTLTTLPVSTNGLVLKLVGGLPSWQPDLTTGGGGGAGAWSTTTDSLAVYPTNTSNVIIIGAAATSTQNSIFEVAGRSYFSNTVGIATTSPSNAFKLDVQGNGLFSGNISAANITATGTATVGNLTIGTLTGVLKAASGVVSAATAGVDFENPLTFAYPLVRTIDAISLAFGTTTANSWNAQNTFTGIFATNASSTNATTTNFHITSATNGGLAVDANGRVYSAATTTAGTGLTYSGNALNVNTTQNISTLSNLTSNGLVKTSGGTGALSIATPGTDYVAGGAGAATTTLSTSGVLSFASANPVVFGSSPITLSITQAGTGASGYLSQTDFNTFNNKISSTSLSGGTGISYNSSTGIITNTGLISYDAWTHPLSGWSATTSVMRVAGLYSTASSTIGDGTQTGGLTISGGATTTGNAYFGGNVGIGGQPTTNALSVTGTASVSSQIYTPTINDFTSANNARINFGGASKYIAFNTNNTEAVRISSVGNLGIGSTSPYAKLGVSGFSSGAGIVADALSGFTGNLFDLKVASTTKFAINEAGTITTSLASGLIKSTAGVLGLATAGTDYVAGGAGAATTTVSASGPLSLTANPVVFGASPITLSITQSGTGASGYLSQTDFNTFNNKISSTSLSGASVISYNSGTGVITTSGGTFGSGDYIFPNKVTSPYASSTAFSAAYASSTNAFFGNLSIGNLTGVLRASAGAVTTGLVNLASEVTGILPATNGGTGWGNIVANSILLGNGAGAISTTSAGTNGQVLALVSGVPTWVATSSINNGVSSIQQTGGGTAQTGAVTFATSSATVNGQTHGLNITNTGAAFTFTPTLSGTLTVAGGGTGVGTFTSGQLLYGNGTNALSSVATTTFTPSGEFTVGGTLGALIGGSNSTLGLATNGVALTKLAQIAANTILGNATGATGNVTAFATSSLGINLGDTTGTLSIARGGTGSTTAPQGQILYGGASSYQSVATSSVAAGTGVSFTGTPGALVGGTSLTINNTGLLSLQQTGGGAAQTGAITFATTSDTNLGLNITNTGGAFTFTPTWTGTLAAGRLNGNVVQGVTNDTNVTGSISAQNLTLGWTGTLAVSRGGTGWGNIQAGAIPYGNGTGALATTTQGTGGFVLAWANGVPTWVATSSINNGLTSIGPAGQLQTGPAVTLASSTTGTDFTITGAGNTLTFNLPSASATNRGLLTSGDWSVFQNKISSTSLSASAPLNYNSGTGAFTITQATTGANGYLSSTDFNTFNNKISSTSLSGGTGISYNSSTGIITNTGLLSYDAWSHSATYGATASATTSPLWAQSGLYASSTVAFGTAGKDVLFNASNGFLGIGSTTPWAQLSVNPNGIGSAPAFVIGSSTATKFEVDNAGHVLIGTTTAQNSGFTIDYNALGFGAGFNIFGAANVGTLSAGRLTLNSSYSSGTNGGYIENVAGALNLAPSSADITFLSSNGGTEVARFKSSNKTFGIGSTSPYARLAVSGFSSGAGIVADALSGFTGNLFDLKLASSTVFAVNQAGTITTALGTGLVKSTSGVLGLGVAGADYIAGGAGAATTTLSTSGVLSLSANPVVFGASPITLSITQSGTGASGYLSQTDFNTFNNKISSTSLSATFPLAYNSSTGAFTYGGLSTSTAAVVGNIPYFSGANTFANVATTTETLGAEFSFSGTYGARVGGTSGTLTLATNGVALTKIAQIAANTILGNNTGATGNVTAIATSTLFGTGTGGQVLTWANGVPTFVATTTYSAPLVFSAGNVTINNAAADGSTKGAASFGANDFDASSGNITIDYTNGQKASASVPGFLSSADYTTFQNKISSTSLSGGSVISYNSGTGVITTTGGTFGAGNYIFPGSVTAPYASSTAFSSSYASSTNGFFGALNIGTLSGLLKGTAGAVSVATAGTDYIAGGAGAATTTLAASGPLSLTANPVVFGASPITLSITQAGTGASGYLSQTDFNTFNNKISSTSLSATFPLAYNSSTGAFTYGGLSTSTAAVIGNIPYFSGVNTFANVATSTRTYSGEFSNTGTLGYQIGGTNSVVSLATNGVALTKLAQIAANTILGNNTGATGNVTAFATSTLFGTGTGGTVLTWNNGVPSWVGTTTAGTGLTYNAGSPGSFSVNTTQNIAKLSNLTSNGFVKTSGSDGTLSIDTNTYLTSAGAVTSLAGTPNQITASASTGAVTLSIPSLFSIQQASTTQLSALGPLYIGTTSTTTIQGGATSTFSGGIALTAGCFSVGGTCIGTPGASGTVTSGTTGQLPYYAANGNTLTATSSIFITSASNVGIGTAGPTNYGAGIRTLAIDGTNTGRLDILANGIGAGALYNNGSTFRVGNTAPNPLALITNDTEQVVIDGSGNVTFPGGGSLTLNTGLNGLLKATSGLIAAATAGVDYLASYDAFTHPSAGQSATTSLMLFNGNASTTQLSAATGFFNSIQATSTAATSTFASGIQVGNGSAANPSLSFVNDSDTGIYGDAGNNIYFTAGGSQRFLISGAQFYGYGSPTIKGSTGMTLSTDAGSIVASPFSGAFGIGTTTPKWALTIASSTKPQLTLSDGSLTSAPYNFRSINGNFYLSTSSPTTFATSTLPALTILSSGNVGIGTSSPTNLFTVAASDSSITEQAKIKTTATDGLAQLIFENDVKSWQLGTRGDIGDSFSIYETTVGDKLTIRPGGNVGIGTTSPYRTLSVQGAAGISGDLSAANVVATGTLQVSGQTTLATSLSGLLKATAGVIGNATAGTDYIAGGAGAATTTVSCSGGTSCTGFVAFGAAPITISSTAGLTSYDAWTHPNNLGYSATTSVIGIGTTTPEWSLTVSSSTAPQIALTDASLTSDAWTMRSINGNLYFASSSPTTFATSSTAALTLNTLGQLLIREGSLTAPSIAPLTNTDSGLAIIGGSNLSWVVDGVERTRLGSGGLTANTGGYAIGSSVGSPSTYLNETASGSGILAIGRCAVGGCVNDKSGRVVADVFGLGTSSPSYALLSVTATSTTGNNFRTLFTIASTTGGTATSTLFNIDNIGTITTALGSGLVKSTAGILGLSVAGTDYIAGGAGAATTTVSCSGSASCTSFVAFGSSPITITASGGGTDPFSHSATFGATASATTSPLWAQSGLYASSTIAFGTAGKNLTFSSSNGFLGLGTTTPTQAMLEINAAANHGIYISNTNGTPDAVRIVNQTAGVSNEFDIWQSDDGTTNLGNGNGGFTFSGGVAGAFNGGSSVFKIQNGSGSGIADVSFRDNSGSEQSDIGYYNSSASLYPSSLVIASEGHDTVFDSNAEILRIKASGAIGIGTSTPKWSLTIASSTKPQLTLSDGSATKAPFNFRSINGNLYISTSSPTTFATSSASALAINTNGDTTITHALSVSPGGATGANTLFDVGSGQLTVNPNGVAIGGDQTPDAMLEVIGGQFLLSSDSTAGTNGNRLSFDALSGFGGVGTTTSHWALAVSSSTAPQLTLTDGSATASPFNFRAINNTLYIGTSSPTTFATTSSSIFALNNATGSTTLQKLDITGNATSSFGAGINLATGCFAVNGVCVGGGGGSLTGSGVANQVTYWSGTSALTGNAGFTFDGTTLALPAAISFANNSTTTIKNNSPYSWTLATSTTGTPLISIDTTTNAETVNIGVPGGPVYIGSVTSPSNLIIESGAGMLAVGTSTPHWAATLSSSTAPQLTLTDASLTSAPFNFRSINGNLFVSTSSPTTYATSTLSALMIRSNGNVGIGNNAPNWNLVIGTDVSTPTATPTTLSLGQTYGNNTAGAEGNLKFIAFDGGPAARYGLGVSGATFEYQVPTGAAHVFYTAGSEKLRLASTGFLGVATGTPWGLLSVNPNALGSGVPEFVVGSSTATHLVVTGAGNVGIGTTTPGKILTIQGATPQIHFYDSNQNRGAYFGVNDAFNAVIDSSVGTVLLKTAGATALTASQGNVGIGTSTPQWKLNIAKDTAPQLTLSDGSLTSAPYNFRAINNTLYISTSSPTTFATTSSSIFALDNSTGSTSIQKLSVTNTGTSSFAGGLQIQAGGFRVNTLASCDTIDTDANGNFICGTDATGAGGSDSFLHQSTYGVTASATSTPFWLQSGLYASSTVAFGTAGKDLFFDSTTGNLGIGSTSPYKPLSVQGAVSTDLAVFSSTNTSGAALRFDGNGTYDGRAWRIAAGGSANAIFGTNPQNKFGIIDATTNAVRFIIDSSAQVGISTTSPFAALAVNPVAGVSNQFVVGSSTATSFIITNAGNVGIGTTSPTAPLSIQSNSVGVLLNSYQSNSINPNYLNITNGAGATARLGVDGSGGGSVFTGTLGNAAVFGNGSAAPVQLATNNTVRLTIDSSGSVGIGTTSPARTLDVKGLIRSSSNFASTELLQDNGTGFRLALDGAGSTYFQGTTNSFGSVVNPIVINNTSGYVGIGTTTPNNALTVQSSTGTDDKGFVNFTAAGTQIGAIGRSTNDLELYGVFGLSFNTTAASNPAMRILTNGNVGIGTTTPLNKLSLVTSFSTNTNDGILITDGQGGSNLAAVGLKLKSDASGSYRGALDVIGGASTFEALSISPYTGYVGIGTTTPVVKFTVNAGTSNYAAVFKGQNSGAVTIGSYPTVGYGFIQGVNSDSVTANSNLLINPDGGNVGIGTTSPWAKLSVQTSSDAAGAFVVANSGNTSVFQVDTLNTANNIFEVATSTGTAYFDITRTGNVGIGSTSPASLLTVVGGGVCISGSGASVACGNTAGTLYYRSASAGTYDVAENYLASDLSLAPGKIAALDLSGNSTITTAGIGGIPFGVISTAPGLLLGGSDSTANMSRMRSLALTGRVPVGVNHEGGDIMVGDAITLSHTPGIGMKATTTSDIIGFALEPYNGTGTSTIEVFVRSEFWFAPQDRDALSSLLQFGHATGTASTTVAAGSFMDSFLKNVFGQVSKWLADAGNGIGNLFADKVHTKQICVGDPGNETCITKAQLDSLLSGAAAAPITGGGGSTPPPPPPPPTDGGGTGTSTPPADTGTTTPPADTGSTPPADTGGTPPADTTTPPPSDTSTPPPVSTPPADTGTPTP